MLMLRSPSSSATGKRAADDKGNDSDGGEHQVSHRTAARQAAAARLPRKSAAAAADGSDSDGADEAATGAPFFSALGTAQRRPAATAAAAARKVPADTSVFASSSVIAPLDSVGPIASAEDGDEDEDADQYQHLGRHAAGKQLAAKSDLRGQFNHRYLSDQVSLASLSPHEVCVFCVMACVRLDAANRPLMLVRGCGQLLMLEGQSYGDVHSSVVVRDVNESQILEDAQVRTRANSQTRVSDQCAEIPHARRSKCNQSTEKG
jgi:hypothetical protein